MSKKEAVLQELLALSEANNGFLNAHHVVEFARNPQTALHSKFDWDDSVAGHNWRLHQARMIINVLVTPHPQLNREIQTWVSIQSDRNRNGGYRTTEAVLADVGLRSMLVAQMLKYAEMFMAKFRTMNEAVLIIEAIERTIEIYAPKKRGRPPGKRQRDQVLTQ